MQGIETFPFFEHIYPPSRDKSIKKNRIINGFDFYLAFSGVLFQVNQKISFSMSWVLFEKDKAG